MGAADTKQTRGGVDRSHGRSLTGKSVFLGGHLLIILICSWLLFSDGLSQLGHLVHRDLQWTDPNRACILFACALLYGIRHGITLFYLLARKVEYGEVFGLLLFMALFEIGLMLIGGGAFGTEPVPFRPFDVVAVVLVLIGSGLNSGSEIQRKLWKKDPANRGHCYTGGLFRYSMHINYFGDTVLFTGWSLLTVNHWTLALPLMMAASFIFFHIPALDAYLDDRYGEEFRAYAARTRKFIPFIY